METEEQIYMGEEDIAKEGSKENNKAFKEWKMWGELMA